jgi:hypothetical protein
VSDGEIFDPAIHATDKDGNPSLNKDGSYRKKRKDSSRGAAKAAAPASSEGKRRADEQAGYTKAVAGLLQVPASLLSLVDPVDGYCAAQLVDPWSQVLGELAMEYPQLAAAIERAKVAGPLAGIIGVGLLTVAQFGHNHGKIPAHIATMLGARPRTEIEQILTQRGAQLAAEAEQQRKWDAEDAEADARLTARLQAMEAEEAPAGGVEHGYAEAI